MSGKSKDFSMKKLLLALAATSVLAACGKKEEAAPAAPAAPASAPAAAAPAPEAGPLKVAIDPTYEPFTFKSADGQPTGFDVDVANALCEQIKRKCEFVEQVWDSMIPGLNAKKYDVIISSMSITDDRMKEVDFTDKYYNTPSRIVLKKGVKFTDAASIKGKKIGVLKGSTQEKYALGDLKPAGVIVNSYEAQDQVYLDIKSGRLDGTVADYMEVTGGFLSKPEGAKYELVGPDLKMPQYFGYGAGIALRKGEDKLKGELNEAIKAIRTNGTYKTLNDKYFAKYNIDVYGE
jgi:arginine/ornithine transport system substrate-binding protein